MAGCFKKLISSPKISSDMFLIEPKCELLKSLYKFNYRGLKGIIEQYFSNNVENVDHKVCLGEPLNAEVGN